MTLSIWRFAHLALALISSLFLIILAATGVILAFDTIDEKTPNYRIENFENISLAQTIPALREGYFEILTVSVDHNDFVSIDALDEDGNSINAYINPITGEIIGEIIPKSQFIQWTTALHRSLFLKETGRFIVGFVSLLLFLITITGFILIIKRQNGFKNFFSKVHKEFFSQYFHVVAGRWLLIPVLIIALTGTIIFIVRMDFMQFENTEIIYNKDVRYSESKNLSEIDFLNKTLLKDITKIEFPFIPDDENEPFIIHFNDKLVSLNQVNGEILHESKFSYAKILEKINLDLHTGRTNFVWAIILGLASLNILFFIFSGFRITYNRSKTKIKNKYNATNAEIVILVGSENGSTLFFANQIHKQLLYQGEKSFLAKLNQYQTFKSAKQILIFTSTYGNGVAPSSANNFDKLVKKHPQTQQIFYSVVGFGSKNYEDYCAFAHYADEILNREDWSEKIVDIHTVNDKSTNELIEWIDKWSAKTAIQIPNTPALYQNKVSSLKTFKVIEKTEIKEDNSTFKIVLKPIGNYKFQSGDLIAFYPKKDNLERLYSIGKKNKNIQLMVKLYENGIGSNFLYKLKENQRIQGQLIANSNFNFPKNASEVILIANGTGIAPFLGMITSNLKLVPTHLYAGFKFNDSLAKEYLIFANTEIDKKRLKTINFAFSREDNKQYVMDLIKRDSEKFANILKNNGVIMICGSLNMQKDVENLLNEISLKINNSPLQFYKDNNQILTDCY